LEFSFPLYRSISAPESEIVSAAGNASWLLLAFSCFIASFFNRLHEAPDFVFIPTGGNVAPAKSAAAIYGNVIGVLHASHTIWAGQELSEDDDNGSYRSSTSKLN
jgi:hypothetical protein